MKNPKPTIKKKCYNCKFASKGFKIDKVTHYTCELPSLQEAIVRGEFHAFDALTEFSWSCKNHEYNQLNVNKIKAM